MKLGEKWEIYWGKEVERGNAGIDVTKIQGIHV